MRNHLVLLLVLFLPCLFRIFVLLLLHLLLGRTSGSVRSGPMAGRTRTHRTHREFGEGETIAFGPSFTHLTSPHLTPWLCYGGHA
uniref:Putative secreted protein n=1 Tax=Anopheles darlingi TaxID=43151 RepID=A0A2M4DQJ7_ANODA